MPYPLGATYRRRRHQLLAVQRGGPAGAAVPVRRRRLGAPDQPRRGRRLLLARLPAQRRARSALRLPDPRRWAPELGLRSNPKKLADRPVRQGHRGHRRLGPALLPVQLRRRAVAQRRRQRALSSRGASSTTPTSTGATTVRSNVPAPRDDRLRGPRQGVHRHPPQHPEELARHLCRPGPPGGHRLPHVARGHRGRAAARPPVRPRRPSGRPAAAQLLGLQLDRFLRPPQRVQQLGRAGRAGRTSSRPWCATCTRPASR